MATKLNKHNQININKDKAALSNTDKDKVLKYFPGLKKFTGV